MDINRQRATARTEVANFHGKLVARDEVHKREKDSSAENDEGEPACSCGPALFALASRAREGSRSLLVVQVASTAERAHVAFGTVARNTLSTSDTALVIEARVHLRILVDDWVIFDGVPRVSVEFGNPV
jgi:hypothetical protein